jgi:hypothetical protein
MSTVYGVDWSTKDIAIGVYDGEQAHCGVAFSRGDGPARLLSLFARTRELAQATLTVHGPPSVVYVETAFGDANPQLVEASGAVKVGLWSVLHDQMDVADFRTVSTTSWRSWAGLKPPREGGKREKRRARKLQQREFAGRYVDVTSLTEHECDAVCIAVAAASRGVQLAA